MKIGIVLLILCINTHCYAELTKPVMDVNLFFNQMKIKNNDYLFKNESNDGEEGFEQVFFRDETLDSKYSSFNIGIAEYTISYKNNNKWFIYGETFLDCDSKRKIRHEQTFDENGIFIRSDAYYFDFKDETLPMSKIVCEKESKKRVDLSKE